MPGNHGHRVPDREPPRESRASRGRAEPGEPGRRFLRPREETPQETTPSPWCPGGDSPEDGCGFNTRKNPERETRPRIHRTPRRPWIPRLQMPEKSPAQGHRIPRTPGSAAGVCGFSAKAAPRLHVSPGTPGFPSQEIPGKPGDAGSRMPGWRLVCVSPSYDGIESRHAPGWRPGLRRLACVWTSPGTDWSGRSVLDCSACRLAPGWLSNAVTSWRLRHWNAWPR